MFGHRQPQPDAAVFIDTLAFTLHELSEDPFLLIFRDSDARVPDIEIQIHAVVSRFGAPHGNRDVSRLGKLDCIADEIGQDLQ